MWATIEIAIMPYDIEPPRDRKSVKLHASLSGVRARYKASGREPMMLENDGSFAREIRLDQADDDMFPVVRPIPQEVIRSDHQADIAGQGSQVMSKDVIGGDHVRSYVHCRECRALCHRRRAHVDARADRHALGEFRLTLLSIWLKASTVFEHRPRGDLSRQ